MATDSKAAKRAAMDDIVGGPSSTKTVELAQECLGRARSWLGSSAFAGVELRDPVITLCEFSAAAGALEGAQSIHEKDEPRLANLGCVAPVLARCRVALEAMQEVLEDAERVKEYFSGARAEPGVIAALKALEAATEPLACALGNDQQ